MSIARKVSTAAAASVMVLSMGLIVPQTFAADCGGYGQPACPTPTVSPTPSATPTPTPTPSATPTRTPTPTPTPSVSVAPDLCGFPPVKCEPGVTNPPLNEPIGNTPAARAQAGMTLVSEEVAKDTPPTTPKKPAAENKIGSAPKLTGVTRGDAVKVRTKVDAGVTYRVKVKRNDGPYNFVGTVTAAANGTVTAPTIQFDRRGTYTIAMESGNNSTFYVKVEVE